MRTGRQHCARPIAKALLIGKVELRGRGSEAVEIASDIIQRNQTVVTVKGSVFQSLSHHRTGELLDFHGKRCHCISISGILPFGNASQKHLADEVKNASIGGWTSPLGCGNCAPNVTYVFIRNLGGSDVSA